MKWRNFRWRVYRAERDFLGSPFGGGEVCDTWAKEVVIRGIGSDTWSWKVPAMQMKICLDPPPVGIVSI